MATAPNNVFRLSPPAINRAAKWASPTLERMYSAIEAEMARLSDSDRDQDRAADLRDAIDKIMEADDALENAVWAE